MLNVRRQRRDARIGGVAGRAFRLNLGVFAFDHRRQFLFATSPRAQVERRVQAVARARSGSARRGARVPRPRGGANSSPPCRAPPPRLPPQPPPAREATPTRIRERRDRSQGSDGDATSAPMRVPARSRRARAVRHPPSIGDSSSRDLSSRSRSNASAASRTHLRLLEQGGWSFSFDPRAIAFADRRATLAGVADRAPVVHGGSSLRGAAAATPPPPPRAPTPRREVQPRVSRRPPRTDGRGGAASASATRDGRAPRRRVRTRRTGGFRWKERPRSAGRSISEDGAASAKPSRRRRSFRLAAAASASRLPPPPLGCSDLAASGSAGVSAAANLVLVRPPPSRRRLVDGLRTVSAAHPRGFRLRPFRGGAAVLNRCTSTDRTCVGRCRSRHPPRRFAEPMVHGDLVVDGSSARMRAQTTCLRLRATPPPWRSLFSPPTPRTRRLSDRTRRSPRRFDARVRRPTLRDDAASSANEADLSAYASRGGAFEKTDSKANPANPGEMATRSRRRPRRKTTRLHRPESRAERVGAARARFWLSPPPPANASPHVFPSPPVSYPEIREGRRWRAPASSRPDRGRFWFEGNDATRARVRSRSRPRRRRRRRGRRRERLLRGGWRDRPRQARGDRSGTAKTSRARRGPRAASRFGGFAYGRVGGEEVPRARFVDAGGGGGGDPADQRSTPPGSGSSFGSGRARVRRSARADGRRAGQPRTVGVRGRAAAREVGGHHQPPGHRSGHPREPGSSPVACHAGSRPWPTTWPRGGHPRGRWAGVAA